jgi:hypothetical protein
MIPQRVVYEPPEGDIGTVYLIGYGRTDARRNQAGVWMDIQDERGAWVQCGDQTAATFDDDPDEPYIPEAS